jgi:uncharacterized membrane protein YbaN (DUF454 family)
LFEFWFFDFWRTCRFIFFSYNQSQTTNQSHNIAKGQKWFQYGSLLFSDSIFMMLKRQNLFAAVTVVSLLLLSIFYIYTKQNATADSNSISDFQSNTLSSANKENEKIIMGAMGNQTERYEDIRWIDASVLNYHRAELGRATWKVSILKRCKLKSTTKLNSHLFFNSFFIQWWQDIPRNQSQKIASLFMISCICFLRYTLVENGK